MERWQGTETCWHKTDRIVINDSLIYINIITPHDDEKINDYMYWYMAYNLNHQRLYLSQF